jgi:protein-arginine kinase activator protein McsA
MKITYNWEERIKTCVCQACGYRHSEEMYYTHSTIEGNEPFIEMEGFELHSTDRSDGWHPSHNTHTIYACPKCGVLQIEV